ncbi:photosystem II reaction center protein PsbX [cyanobacterium endosymbiont of Rhopalodia gibberula]|nr:photosystem II reaction center protein PsbX [cyanobacterium endosymbiont of Rhopalodia gibberula]
MIPCLANFLWGIVLRNVIVILPITVDSIFIS